MSGDNTVCCSVRLPEDVNDEIERRLDYGDSKDSWIREAIAMRLADCDDVEAPREQ